jgi:hypothetical protein
MKNIIIKNLKTNTSYDFTMQENKIETYLSRKEPLGHFGKPERWVRAKVEKVTHLSSNPDEDASVIDIVFPDDFYEESDVIDTEERPKFPESDETETWVKLKAEYTIEITDYKKVPRSVTKRQAKQALLQADLLDTIETYMETAPRTIQIDWYDSQEIRRDWDSLETIAGELNLTSEQIDDLFILAETL